MFFVYVKQWNNIIKIFKKAKRFLVIDTVPLC